jgi:hypothetical protein
MVRIQDKELEQRYHARSLFGVLSLLGLDKSMLSGLTVCNYCIGIGQCEKKHGTYCYNALNRNPFSSSKNGGEPE